MRRLLLGVLLFSLLTSIYGLSYNGVPQTDDEQLFASTAINFANTGRLSASQLFGNTRLEGNYYGVGPLFVLLLSIIVKWINFSSMGVLQALFLINVFITALTAVALFVLAKKFGFSDQVSILASVIYGIGTIAWVYSTSLFREPLAALLILVTWLGLEVYFNDQERLTSRYFGLLIGCLGLIALIFIKEILIVAIPAFVIHYFIVVNKKKRKVIPYSHLLLFAIPLIVILLIMKGDIFFSIPHLSNRISEDIIVIASQRLFRMPHNDFGVALFGALLSPGKGIIIYSPILIYSIISCWKYFWKKVEIFLFPGIMFFGLLLVQVINYDGDWWGISWGTRFILPCLPLVVLMSVPMIEDIVHANSKPKLLIFTVLLVGSVFIQSGGILISESAYLVTLYKKFHVIFPDLVVWNASYSPIVGHWTLALSGNGLDLAWFRLSDKKPVTSILYIIFFSALALITGYKLVVMNSKPGLIYYPLRVICIVLIIITMIPFVILSTFVEDPYYYSSRYDIKSAFQNVELNTQEGDVVMIRSYLLPVWYYGMNYFRSSGEWYSLPITEDIITGEVEIDYLVEERVQLLIENLMNKHNRFWLITDQMMNEDYVPKEEKILLSHYHNKDIRIFRQIESGQSVRVSLYFNE